MLEISFLALDSRLKFRIVRTKGTSVITLNSLKILGLSCAADKALWVSLMSRLSSRFVTTLPAPKFFNSEENTREKESIEKPCPEIAFSNQCGVKPPSDFLDALTCELMRIPMVLPCGQIVDKSTIDKHRENEIKQGKKLLPVFIKKKT